MKPITNEEIDLSDYLSQELIAEPLIRCRQLMSIGLFRTNKNYGESPLAKCIPELRRMQQLEAFYKGKL